MSTLKANMCKDIKKMGRLCFLPTCMEGAAQKTHVYASAHCRRCTSKALCPLEMCSVESWFYSVLCVGHLTNNSIDVEGPCLLSNHFYGPFSVAEDLEPSYMLRT
jgi:hypothetical protein